MKAMTKASRSAAYSLRRGLNAWELTFAGQIAVLKHEQGLVYVAYLLYHPGAEALHALELRLRSWHPAGNGKAGLVCQRSAALDDAETERALFRKQRELEALVGDASEPEPVRSEAQRELEAIYDHQKSNLTHTHDNAVRATNAVRKAVSRLHRKLMRSLDMTGRPHPVLRAFGRHLEDYLLAPSIVAGRHRATAGAGTGCRFKYQPPPGVVWEQ